MQVERLQEPIKVRADFQGGQATPLRVRRGPTGAGAHRIVSVDGRWVDRSDRYPRFGFAVTLETGDSWRIILRTTDLTWWLEDTVNHCLVSSRRHVSQSVCQLGDSPISL